LATAYGFGGVVGRWTGLGAGCVAWAYTVALVVVILVPYSAFSFRCAGLDPWAVVPSIRGAAWATVTMGMVVGLLREAAAMLPVSAPSARLALLVTVGCLVYLVTARHEIGWLVSHGWAEPHRLRSKSTHRLRPW